MQKRFLYRAAALLSVLLMLQGCRSARSNVDYSMSEASYDVSQTRTHDGYFKASSSLQAAMQATLYGLTVEIIGQEDRTTDEAPCQPDIEPGQADSPKVRSPTIRIRADSASMSAAEASGLSAETHSAAKDSVSAAGRSAGQSKSSSKQQPGPKVMVIALMLTAAALVAAARIKSR